MSIFRPCIDLHDGLVKQIVGGKLTHNKAIVNHVSPHDAAHFAALYRDSGLQGGHIISLGENNREQVLSALKTFPGGLQYGGGVTAQNAGVYIEAGASHVIVTSYLFEQGSFSPARLEELVRAVGREHIVIDLSCRKTTAGWVVSTNRWQTLTEQIIDAESIKKLEANCNEFLIHSADVEGMQAGMDEQLIKLLGTICNLPTTYAGGGRSVKDLEKIQELSRGKIDLSIGSALDIFGGNGITLEQCIYWNQATKAT
ncbi:MAG: phosphoribosylformimino-5-aminoimidazole carboxamide ribotide isomerase [Cellvibrionales bacterium TMED148]|nr:phosphoribosylformimino-5-aminoimidazole carboxamide ribotide isomerase [Porticoccaceae bacterium]RPG94014.1 MAG: phosphoribosylformimino-5-aminoimidazole carboxamide ribotide isomerase [Cellvibrionales bacterium TMED148]